MYNFLQLRNLPCILFGEEVEEVLKILSFVQWVLNVSLDSYIYKSFFIGIFNILL